MCRLLLESDDRIIRVLNLLLIIESVTDNNRDSPFPILKELVSPN